MEQYVKELMRRAVKPKHYAPVVSHGYCDIWGMDLADMALDWANVNDGYKYVLVVVDVFSRFAWCRELKTKDATTVWIAFNSILKESKKKPHKIWVDQGGEFYNKIWTDKLKSLNITRYSSFGDSKVSIAERFIRTLKTNLWFSMLTKGTHTWYDKLQTVVNEYNHSKHSSLGMSPSKATQKGEED